MVVTVIVAVIIPSIIFKSYYYFKFIFKNVQYNFIQYILFIFFPFPQLLPDTKPACIQLHVFFLLNKKEI